MKSVLVTTTNNRFPLEMHEDSVTPKDILNKLGINPAGGINSIDGVAMSATEMNTPIGEILGGAESCVISQVIKANNA